MQNKDDIRHASPFRRRLRVDIVCVFMALFSLACGTIISYSFKRNYESVLAFSETEINRIGLLIQAGNVSLIRSAERVPQNIEGIIPNPEAISDRNEIIKSYFKKLAITYPHLDGFAVSSLDGGIITVDRLKTKIYKTFIMEPQKLLPIEAVYSYRVVKNPKNNPEEYCVYLDDNFNEIARETIVPSTFDARTRPWFQSAVENDKVIWTDIYDYYFDGQQGITVAYALKNKEGQKIGVASADLSVRAISGILNQLQIGKTGRAVVLDQNTGKIILPLDQGKQHSSAVSNDVIQAAYLQHIETGRGDIAFEFNDKVYLSSQENLPDGFLGFVRDPHIYVIAPFDDFFSDLISTQQITILISIGIFIISCIGVVLFSNKISNPIAVLAKEIDKIKNLDLSSNLEVKSSIIEINLLNRSIVTLRQAIASFSKYVPKRVVKKLLDQGQGIELGGEKKEIAVVFTDIVGFTTLAEKTEVNQLMPLLEDYYDEISRVLLSHNAIIDKYIGDAVMAFWLQEDLENETCREACRCLLDCKKALHLFNNKRLEKNLPPFLTKFGLDFGTAIVGNIGTAERINYTAIGDVVNSAARLQVLNSKYGTEIIISEAVKERLSDVFVTKSLGQVQVKGKQQSITIYELLDMKNSQETSSG
jgi:adenylate cyclase